ncbi:malonic semialdehyde reductase [Rhodobium gokarnense]|uniref:Putative NADH dehydrogenase/NAD(P)H nitroreductase M2319_004447 n=1 Tax=Rhodobium gokarnense TaxID=364296 RepID=A0ABT3HI72_9HYPH|nr:malonic semialdehyde reductase [Rhodobium gokarnense]MCW2310082.1 3-hydroxypropanoate dehydrogenase [Rhodobium gokarnense]
MPTTDYQAFHEPLADAALDQLFRQARTHNGWQDRAVDDTTLRALADLMKWGPTAANCLPARIVFVKSDEAKDTLIPLMSDNNKAKTRAAPVTAIVGYDLEFYEHLPKLFPHADARSWFAGNEEAINGTAFRNGSLQGAYMILAARALGLDAGPMSGFDEEGVNAAFFAGTKVRANFICNLGYGDPEALFDRLPRFEFEDFCKIL